MRAGCRILQYLRERFGPNPASVPVVNVTLVSLCAYDELAAVYAVKPTSNLRLWHDDTQQC